MNRRGFLSDLIASVAGGSVVLKAEPRAIELFQPKIEEPVMIASPTLDSVGGYLYDKAGTPVALITEIHQEVDRFNFGGTADHHQQFIPGPVTTHIRALGIRNIDWYTDVMMRKL